VTRGSGPNALYDPRRKKAAHRGFFYAQLEPLAQTAGEENIAPDLHRHGMRATGRLNFLSLGHHWRPDRFA